MQARNYIQAKPASRWACVQILITSISLILSAVTSTGPGEKEDMSGPEAQEEPRGGAGDTQAHDAGLN